MTLILQGPRARIAQVPFLFRAAACVDESGIYAMSYGRRIGGTFSRSSRKYVPDDRGRELLIPSESLPLSKMLGETVVLLEPARENLVSRAQELNLWTSQNGGVATADVTRAPDGSLSADLVSGPGGIAAQGIWRGLSFPSDGVHALSAFIREGTGTDTRIALSVYDQTAAMHRHLVVASWLGGVPQVAKLSGNGSIFPVEPREDRWWRILLNAENIVALNVNRMYVYAAGQSAQDGGSFVWGTQSESGPFPTSYFPTGASTGTRQHDGIAFNPRLVFGPASFYLRLRRELGTNSVTGSYFLLRPTSGATPNFRVERGSGGRYRMSHNSGAVDVNGSTVVDPSYGDLVEIRGVVHPSGATQCGLSVNGGPESLGAMTAANPIQAVLADQVRIGLVLNAPLPVTHGLIDYGVRSMDELRALAGV